jgi:lysylphosphatidylglycerol synthetase-like protein (DUF2156 family)
VLERWLHGFTALVRRYPATAAIVLTALAVGVATGALWSDVSDNTSLYDAVAYGLPPLRDGRWWTFFTGAFFVPELVLYVPVLALLIAAASTYERRVGRWQTLLIVIGGQAAGAIVTALLLWPFRDSGWSWAVALGRTVDVGISAGGFAVLGALTAVMQPVWRKRVRVGVTAYLVAMVLQSGLLWDVEHLMAWLIGLAVGPLLIGRLPQIPSLEFGRRTQRALVALIIAVQAIAVLVEAVFPGNGGPFWSGNDRHEPTHVTLSLVITSIILLLAADGLRRGRRFAWGLITALMALTFLGLLDTDANAERAADLILVGSQLLLLLVTYRAFDARTRRRSFRRVGWRLLLVALVLFAYTAIGFAVLKDDFHPTASPADMVGEFVSRLFFTSSGNIEPVTTAAKWFVRSIGAVWIAAWLVALVGLLYSSRRPKPPEPVEDSRLRNLLQTYNSSSIEWMLTWHGNSVWFSDDGGTAIGYRVVGSVALCLADPVGPRESKLAALRAFDEHCARQGWIPCLFAAGEETAALAPQLRWKAVQVAEDSIVALEDLEFKGKPWQDVRTAMNKAAKQDIRLDVTRWQDSRPVVTDQLKVISSAWVADKALPEMGFTLGSLAEADDPEVRLHLAVGDDGTVEGITSWMPVHDNGQVVGWTVDLMRRRDEGFRPVMEFLIGASALQFKEEGYAFISLSAAPLAKAPERLGENSDQQVLQKLLNFLGDTLEPYYGFRSLLAFKAKFQPQFRPMFLVFPDETALAEIGLAITRAYMPDATPKDWLQMTWQMARH